VADLNRPADAGAGTRDFIAADTTVRSLAEAAASSRAVSPTVAGACAVVAAGPARERRRNRCVDRTRQSAQSGRLSERRNLELRE
jgi:hypothetical protein